MSLDPEISAIGVELIKCSEESEFTAQRGLVDELFPYIYQASKRMSTRAISRWLLSAKNIKLSAVTIAKALRESERHWADYYDEIEPDALIFARAHEVSEKDVLADEDLFTRLCQEKILKIGGLAGFEEYSRAQNNLKSGWFQLLDKAAREECLDSTLADAVPPAEGSGEGNGQ